MVDPDGVAAQSRSGGPSPDYAPAALAQAAAKSRWDTHPPSAERIVVLQGLTGQFGQDPRLIDSGGSRAGSPAG